jgi:hypothetical protein
VNNTITQSTSQSGSNTYTDNDVINITQTITGTYNGSGHVNTNIAVDNSNTVTQGVNQNIDQDASIKKCGEAESGAGSNQTNTIDMNATQLASNAYSDDTTIIIVQTIIIPKSCDTNVDAPVGISDRNTVAQTANQDISQEGDIAYGGSGDEGSNTNTATQVSMQVAANNATNDEVITINQVIIVPPDCPAQVQAPIVIEGNNNVNMTVSQTAVQDAEINANGGVAIVSTVSGAGQPAYTTNTVIMSGSQGAQNTFSDDDTIIIQQKIYYVNDTVGWTEENFEENLAEEFGGPPDNSTSPVTEDPPGAGNNTSGETLAPIDTGGGDEIEPAPGPSNSTEPVSEEIVAADPPPEENPGDIEPPADTTEEAPSDSVESTEPAVGEAVSEQPVVEETVEPTVPEDTPEANTTDSVSEDPSPVESQDASTPEGNSTSVA